ncbi:fibronectin type III domain-containing protein [Zunongwangia profunda]|uniref:fibronectin type III domain-containing protein n=1 Tax=Zunongwangia profunda TaxID=398743 RepID=UPI000C8C8BC0|nr:fibronectin type III domain-containing protein [Zunongwangia profunda]MAG88802.1 hypothetical protein [Flavobacteriaceae bacterium]|tara:strand:+ start:29397 stop:31310 length:1914 start_codon:yes stop_codon:yes gene_type:complete
MSVQGLEILKGYITCEDPATRNKFFNLLDSFWHKADGKVLKEVQTLQDGTKNFIFKKQDDTTEVVSIPALPNTKPQSFITGLEEALGNRVVKVPGKGLSTNDLTAELYQKLVNLQNYVHPDYHQISEIENLPEQLTDIVTALENKQPIAPEGWGFSQQNYSSEEKEKVAGLDDPRWKGKYLSLTALQNDWPEGAGETWHNDEGGWTADVDGGSGENVLRYIWDASDLSWQPQQGISTEETAASIKQKYESNPNTNAFTDDHKTKLENLTETGGENSNYDRGDFSGELDVSGGNNYYNDYTGEAVSLSTSESKSLGSTATVRIQGGKIDLIPASWNISGEPITDNNQQLNELTVIYVRDNDVRIINRIVSLPDNEDPTAPTNITESNITASSFSLAWDESTDNVEVEKYEIYLDQILKAESFTNSAQINGLDPETIYAVYVRAIDSSGNYTDSVSVNIETNQSDPVDVPFTWVDLVNAFDLGGGTIQFDIDNGFGGNRNGGISDKLINGDVIIDFLPLKNAGVQVFGIAPSDFTIADDSNTNMANVELAFVSKPDGTFSVLENNVNKVQNQAGFGDALKCQLIISGNSMSFALDESIVYTSQKLPDFPMSVVQLFNQMQGTGETQAFYRTITNLIDRP